MEFLKAWIHGSRARVQRPACEGKMQFMVPCRWESQFEHTGMHAIGWHRRGEARSAALSARHTRPGRARTAPYVSIPAACDGNPLMRRNASPCGFPSVAMKVHAGGRERSEFGLARGRILVSMWCVCRLVGPVSFRRRAKGMWIRRAKEMGLQAVSEYCLAAANVCLMMSAWHPGRQTGRSGR